MTNEQRAAMRKAYTERRNLFPRKMNGELASTGEDRAIDYLVGIAQGMRLAGVPDNELPTGLVFLASVRGADAVMLDELNEDGTWAPVT